MKKFVFAGFVAAASLGLAACADSADEEMAAEEETAVAEETAAVEPPAEDMDAGEEAMDDMVEPSGDVGGTQPTAELDPNGDTDGPRPSRD